MKRLICFGLGYVATRYAAQLDPQAWEVVGTRRAPAEEDTVHPEWRLLPFDGGPPGDELVAKVAGASHLLVSVPPDDRGDVVLRRFQSVLTDAPRLEWVGYLSSTGVYGDHDGAAVDEESPCRPTSDRARRRLDAERRWGEMRRRHGLPIHVFRLGAIYGPGRSPLDRVRGGSTRRIVREGHRFNRVHVDDIVHVLLASTLRPHPGRVYNVVDDEPASQAEVIELACRLLGVEPGPKVPFEEAAEEMSPEALSFWKDNKRVLNDRLHRELGVELRFPSYREGLRALAGAEPAR